MAIYFKVIKLGVRMNFNVIYMAGINNLTRVAEKANIANI